MATVYWNSKKQDYLYLHIYWSKQPEIFIFQQFGNILYYIATAANSEYNLPVNNLNFEKHQPACGIKLLTMESHNFSKYNLDQSGQSYNKRNKKRIQARRSS